MILERTGLTRGLSLNRGVFGPREPIFSGPKPQSYFNRFKENLQVSRGADFGIKVVHPHDWNFLDTVAELLRERESFDIEPPAGNPGEPENALRRLRGETFESALGVPQSRQEQRLNHEVANAAGNLAIQG